MHGLADFKWEWYSYVHPCPQSSVKYSAQALLNYSEAKHHTTLRSEIFATMKIHNLNLIEDATV
jgi:hypothetical protein